VRLDGFVLVQTKFLNDRLQARSAQDLLLHGCQPFQQIFADDGLDHAVRNLLLLHKHQRLGGVYVVEKKRHGIGEDSAQHCWEQQYPLAPPDDCHVIIECQFAMPEHLILLPP
jgi:hypothetical protein